MHSVNKNILSLHLNQLNVMADLQSSGSVFQMEGALTTKPSEQCNSTNSKFM